jgi:hypothetical protein
MLIHEIKNFVEYVNTQFDLKDAIGRLENEFTTSQWKKLFELHGLSLRVSKHILPVKTVW